MNIFHLDNDPLRAARYHCDKHVVKMVLETAQLLSTAVRTVASSAEADAAGLYKSSHLNHPCSVWARQSSNNFGWVATLGLSLAHEYAFRYGKTHKSAAVITKALEYIYLFPPIGLTPPALAMPDEYKTDDPVESYRRYYIGEKSHMFKWTMRSPPPWVPSDLVERQ